MPLTSAASLAELIAVRPPYFALEGLTVNSDDSVTADIPVQQPLGNEAGPVTAAEAGRHLAILGSCAAALRNPAGGMHHYLAREATIDAVECLEPDIRFQRLTAVAVAGFEAKRAPVAQTELRTPDGTPLFRVQIRYTALTAKMFKRFFATKFVDDPAVSSIPGWLNNDRPAFTTDTNGLTGTLGDIRPEHCMGHFPGCPAMPVAVLMYGLSQACGTLLSRLRHVDQAPYRVAKGFIKCEHLAFAGEQVDLHASCIKQDGGEFTFESRATVGDKKEVGHLLATYRLL